MNKLSLVICFTGLFIFNFTKGYARQDSLVLYTKPGCSNCHSVKLVLQQSGIYFIEKSLDNKEYATEMLHEISIAGYHDKIYLPVIFLNNKLYHPVYSVDTGMVALALPDVVDSIKNKFRRGELNLQQLQQDTTTTSELSTASSDCELKVPSLYLVCSNYNTESEAKVAMNSLIKQGYIFAGIVYIEKQYKVFCKIFNDRIVADSNLNDIKKNYSNAYLFEMP